MSRAEKNSAGAGPAGQVCRVAQGHIAAGFHSRGEDAVGLVVSVSRAAGLCAWSRRATSGWMGAKLQTIIRPVNQSLRRSRQSRNGDIADCVSSRCVVISQISGGDRFQRGKNDADVEFAVAEKRIRLCRLGEDIAQLAQFDAGGEIVRRHARNE